MSSVNDRERDPKRTKMEMDTRPHDATDTEKAAAEKGKDFEIPADIGGMKIEIIEPPHSGVKRPASDHLSRPVANPGSHTNILLPPNDPNYPSKRPRIGGRERKREDEERERDIISEERNYDRERERKKDERDDLRLRDKDRERADKEFERKREGISRFSSSI
jgi:hypothetical protein